MNTPFNALRLIVSNPYGCRFCDSGKLRNSQKQHDDNCGFAMARQLLSEHVTPRSDASGIPNSPSSSSTVRGPIEELSNERTLGDILACALLGEYPARRALSLYADDLAEPYATQVRQKIKAFPSGIAEQPKEDLGETERLRNALQRYIDMQNAWGQGRETLGNFELLKFDYEKLLSGETGRQS